MCFSVIAAYNKNPTMSQPRTWMVRAGEGAFRVEEFLEKGIVSTGGFTREALYEAERANVPITLTDLDMLVSLVIQNYDQFDADARALLPLRKVYWPV